jgi:uncharacterized membrane protein YeiB
MISFFYLPVSKEVNMKRIFAFDIARAFAILGMMIVNYNIVFSYGKVEITFLSNFIYF